ncbi:mannitol dehydrogenase family protein [Lacisediminihabitans profunda]|uniref:Mannitol-1-phosphate 5-dehydrogenase n=1 Tax=Lacisediminihabitans profunda TaxID=2594790 RepID=A0A5C8UU44_9MICO|nr:mannitol dehydrogenase family protein [Lacisediminihabitans profunda]TXN31088.1 mannitol dehydrogenase family protein [Lacisediminihabitans profunda]
MIAEFVGRRSVRHPVRIVHLGLGAFHRAHQAWYTERANADAVEGWGIHAFTGRSAAAAEVLSAQDDLYVLIERGDVDTESIIQSISAATDGADGPAWRAAVADPAVAIVTVTVTERGYRLSTEGTLDLLDADVQADIALLRGGGRPADTAAAVTAPGRLVDGLRARMLAGGPGIAVVSCDNLADNGRATRESVLALASAVDRELADWIERTVSFVSTMVDRITPAATAADRAIALAATGLPDQTPVVTEPFSEWVLSGDFPSGRPAWDAAGARFVDDIAPYERRKLWLLNAAHSLLAYRGLAAGHGTIAGAMLDVDCREAVEALWEEAAEVLPLDAPEMNAAEIEAALAALRSRFANARIEHRLSQIATDGSHKLGPRIIEPMRRRREAGLAVGTAEAGVLAAWATHLADDHFADPSAEALAGELRGLDAVDRAGAVIRFLAPDLADDGSVVAAVAAQIDTQRTTLGARRP